MTVGGARGSGREYGNRVPDKQLPGRDQTDGTPCAQLHAVHHEQRQGRNGYFVPDFEAPVLEIHSKQHVTAAYRVYPDALLEVDHDLLNIYTSSVKIK